MEAEDLALQHLLQQGLTLLERNFHSRRGEIDLVMQQGEQLVFVEVRYRRDSAFGSALESVDQRKQQRLQLAAQYYLQNHPQRARHPCRFDVVGIHGDPGKIDWIRNAFGI